MLRHKYFIYLLTFVFFTSVLFGNASFASAHEGGFYYTGEHDDSDYEDILYNFEIIFDWDVEYMTSHEDDIDPYDLYEADTNDFLYISGHGWTDPNQPALSIPIYEKDSDGDFDVDDILYVREDDSKDDSSNENNFIVSEDEWKEYPYITNTRWSQDLEWAVLCACSQLSVEYGNYIDWALAMCGEPRMHSIWGYPNTAPSGNTDRYIVEYFCNRMYMGYSIFESWKDANVKYNPEWAGVYHYDNKDDCLWGYGDVSDDTDPNDEVDMYIAYYEKDDDSDSASVSDWDDVSPSVQTSSKVLKNQYSEINVKTTIPDYPEELKPLIVKKEKLPEKQLAKDYAKMDIAKADYEIGCDGAKIYRDGSKILEIYDSGAIGYFNRTVSEAVYGEFSKDPDDEPISEACDNGSISENCNDNKSVSQEVYYDEEISFDKEEAIAQARKFISSIGGMPSDISTEPEVFVEKEVKVNFDGGQGKERIVEYGIVFRHDYDLPIRGQGDYIRVSLNNNGVDSFFKHWSEPIGLAEKSQSIVSPDTILEEIEKNVHKYVKLDKNVDITNMQLVYYSQYRKEQTEMYPSWEIEFDRGYKIYVDAFTGKIID